jgi:hypothetical protein
MSAPGPPALVEFTPPQGVSFTTVDECPLGTASRDLCKIAASLQGLAPFGKLVRYDDWYDHDGLYFQRCQTDSHGLFQLVQTPRALLEATPGDDYVCVGIAPDDRSWYLRFRAEWDDQDEKVVRTYSLMLNKRLVERFEGEVIPGLECPVRRAVPEG